MSVPDCSRRNGSATDVGATGISSGLMERISRARSCVYDVGAKTPLERIELGGNRDGQSNVYLKREDASLIRSYKWRGAYFKMAQCVAEGNRGPFVTTSAGNHAQGVALAASRLGVAATIFMPVSTPELKRLSVKRLGAEFVRIVFVGDRFDQTSAAALGFADETGATFVPPFDDLDVIAGQATVASEILEQLPETDVIFVPIGGGGLASGVSVFCRDHDREVRVVGVEVTGQDSMTRSIEAGRRIRMEDVGQFCDGTAVGCPGRLTFELCRQNLVEIVSVSDEQVCGAIEFLWEERRLITEPSGAIALAGLLAEVSRRGGSPGGQDATVNQVAIVSGGNTDFRMLPSIVQGSQGSRPTRKFFRVEIPERRGALIELLDRFLDDINIVDFQYGKTDSRIALPIVGISGEPGQLDRLEAEWNRLGVVAKEVSHEQSVMFRVIPFRDDCVQGSLFLHVDFPNRPGALRDLMRELGGLTNICYFNYSDSGQLEGHALIGFEIAQAEIRERVCDAIRSVGLRFREFSFGSL